MSGLLSIQRPARGTPRGLVVLLHGVGANEQSLLPLAQQLPEDVQVVLPRAPLPFGAAGFGWFQVEFTPQGPVIRPEQAYASRLQLIRFIAAEQERLGVAASRTLVAGFSQGGIMSAGIALTSPTSVHGFGILSGRILPEIEPQIPEDIARHDLHGLILHGRHDSKLGYHFAERSQQRLQHFGVAHTLKTYEADHALTPQMAQDFVVWVQQRLPAPRASAA